MGVKVTGLVDADNLLVAVETDTRRGAAREMVAAGRRIRDLARKMAPVDIGNLEDAIQMTPDSEGPPRDARGRFVRVEVEVYVETSKPVPERPGKTVGDYAYEIHEHQTPMGPIPLGPHSQAKQASNSGITVGGGFLERAADEVTKDWNPGTE